MTKEEQANPDLIDGSRRARIAVGSGHDVSQVGQLIKQFAEMQKMMKSMPGLAGIQGRRNKKKNKKGKKKGGRVTPKGGPPIKPQDTGGGGLSLPGLE